MGKLLRIEFTKLFSSAAFWVLIPIHAVLFFFMALVASNIEISLPGLDPSSYFKFPEIWKTYAWLASWFNVLFAILIIIFVGTEFIYKTWRQHVIDGLSRSELFLSKTAVIVVFSLYAFLLVFIITLAAGFILSDNYSADAIFSSSWITAVYMFQALAYMSIAFFIVVLIKNIALSIVAFVLYLFPAEPIICAFFPDYIDRFFPMKVISHLTPMPGNVIVSGGQPQMYGYVNNTTYNMSPPPEINYDLPLWANLLLAAGYVAIFLTLTWWIIRKRNL